MLNKNTHISLAAIFCGSFLLNACDTGGGQGNLSLAITDAPVDNAQAVWISFNAVSIKPETGDAQTYEIEPQKINLMDLTGNQSRVLLDQPLAAGGYSWIRLHVDDSDNGSYLISDTGATHSLRIPSGAQTGLKLNRAFDINADGVTAFTIDFDLRKSVHLTGTGSYMLRPTLRMVETSMAGSISGTIDPSLVVEACTPGVYVFNQGDAVDDMDGIDDPVVALTVTLSDSGSYDYTAGFLPAGSYTLAFTCEAQLDDAPDGLNNNDDDISFSHQAEVTVSPGADTVHHFAP